MRDQIGGGRKGEGLSNGEDTSNTSKKGRDRGRGGEERVCTCSVVNVSCKLRQECIMEV